MGDECSYQYTNSACLIQIQTDQFSSDVSEENIENLYCLLSEAILTSQEYDFERFG